MNRELLKSIMVLNGDTNKTLAEFLGISVQSFSAKINENGTEFKQSEMAKIAMRYGLSGEHIMKIFFVQNLS